MKVNKRIEIVSSADPDLSSMGEPSRDAIAAFLSEKYTHVMITLISNLADLQELVERSPDLVFLGIKFVPTDARLGVNDPNKIWVSQFLSDNGISHTGSGKEAHELEYYKPLAKQCVLDAGLATSPYCVIKQNQPHPKELMRLTYPLFVKPTNRGGGLGIDSNSVVYDIEQLNAKVQAIASELKSDALVEEYLTGREFSVAILKDLYSGQHAIMPIELIASPDEYGQQILSKEVKTADTERSIEIKDATLKLKINALAMSVFQAVGARDYGRIDIRLNAKGVAQFLEANLVPSLKKSDGNYFPKACMLNLNLNYEAMVLAIVRLALARNPDIYEDTHLATISPLARLQPALEI